MPSIGEQLSDVQQFDFDSVFHIDVPTSSFSFRCRAGVAVVNSQVFAVGGFNGSLRVRTVDVFDPLKDTWSNVASMEARRSTLGAAVLNNQIFAVGGFDGSSGNGHANKINPLQCCPVSTFIQPQLLDSGRFSRAEIDLIGSNALKRKTPFYARFDI